MDKKYKITFDGALSYKGFIVASLGENYEYLNDMDYSNADIIYRVYGLSPNFKKKNNLLFYRKKLIIHWIGTDVLSRVRRSKSKNIKTLIKYRLWNYIIRRKTKNGNLLNFAGAPWLVEELKETGISAEFVPISSLKKENINNKSNTGKRLYDFLSYIPIGRFEFYGGDYVLKLARELKQYRFLIIHPDIDKCHKINKINYPDNIVIMPKITFDKMPEIYNNCKCLLRFTEHDGLSLSVLEAMAYGLQVFWTYKFPFTQRIDLKKIDDALQIISKIVSKWSFNLDGRNFVLKNYEIDVCKVKFKELFNRKIKL